MRSILTETGLAFRRALCLLTYSRTPESGVVGHPAALIALCGIWLATKAVVDLVWAGDDWSFNEWGIFTTFAAWPTIAAAMYVLHPRRRNVPVRLAIIDLAALGIVLNLFVIVVGNAAVGRGFDFRAAPGSIHIVVAIFGWVAVLWIIASLFRVGRHIWRRPPRFAGLRFVAAALLPLLLIPNQPIIYGEKTDWSRFDVWELARTYLARSDVVSASDESDSGRPIIDYEAALYEQPALVEEALRGLEPSPKSRSQFYFVGVAPSSAQSVFKTEVLGAKQVFDDHFETKGRSVALINSIDTMNELPLANATNLTTVLAGVAKQMDREKDALVLFITSHGTRGYVSVQMPGIQFNQITVDVLDKSLASSGIKNKIIIISACHSGSFISKLKGPDTLIMTASSAENTSFGCSNEREWTYFGDALFNHALKNTRSMSHAFSEAAKLIEKWESDQKLTPSEPQISMGSAIENLLANFE